LLFCSYFMRRGSSKLTSAVCPTSRPSSVGAQDGSCLWHTDAFPSKVFQKASCSSTTTPSAKVAIFECSAAQIKVSERSSRKTVFCLVGYHEEENSTMKEVFARINLGLKRAVGGRSFYFDHQYYRNLWQSTDFPGFVIS
jgi:hypothetical protein